MSQAVFERILQEAQDLKAVHQAAVAAGEEVAHKMIERDEAYGVAAIKRNDAESVYNTSLSEADQLENVADAALAHAQAHKQSADNKVTAQVNFLNAQIQAYVGAGPIPSDDDDPTQSI